jgi:hypothetical protein
MQIIHINSNREREDYDDVAFSWVSKLTEDSNIGQDIKKKGFCFGVYALYLEIYDTH